MKGGGTCAVVILGSMWWAVDSTGESEETMDRVEYTLEKDTRTHK